MPLPADRLPVIVGVGEVVDRPDSPLQGMEPIAMMAEALRRAEQDAGAPLLAQCDALDVVREISWPYLDAPGLLAWHLSLPQGARRYSEDGGETPVRYLHEAALRIQRGDAGVVAIAGAEAAHTTAAAWKAGVQLPWPHRDPKATIPTGRELVSATAINHGVIQPAQVYPFFENAFVAAAEQTPAEGIADSAALWSAFSTVAAQQPGAWSTDALSPEAVGTASDRNRWVAWPYTKRMVANPMVNQGAALIVTNLARARELGVPEAQCIHIWGGAYAREPRDYLERDLYTRSTAMDAVLESLLQRLGGDPAVLQALELYSCFPCVPKMARKTLKLPADTALTVTGGMNTFGAPLNNYMTHAAVAMVRRLREGTEAPGLLYGQGEYVTKHHGVVLARVADAEDRFAGANASAQAEADLHRGAVPVQVDDYEGAATLETFTVIFGRDQQPEFGTVIARTPDGRRLMARVPAQDANAMQRLLSLTESPVGLSGRVGRLDDKRLSWTFA